MIPILYDVHATTYTTNGMGRLSDCTSCIVTEERNGIYECEFQYPITGKWYQYMRDRGGIVVCIHDDQHDLQPFDIYAYTAPIDGLVTFYAHHISYRLNRIIVRPFTATSAADAMSQLVTKTYGENPFTFWTDKATEGDFTLDHPEAIRAFLGNQTGSFLDVFGKGDYEFDNWVVRLYANRGSDSGVTIRYGKNLADITVEYDKSGTYNTIRPYWRSSEGQVVYGGAIGYPQPYTEAWTDENGNNLTDENETDVEFYYTEDVYVSMDFSSEFEDEPTNEQLMEAADAFLTANQPWIPKRNITVDFVQLWQTAEYADVAALQRVGLCDRVSVFYPELGVTAENQKVIKVVYNVLTERFDSMELGEPQTTLSDDIRASMKADFQSMLDAAGVSQSMMQAAIDHATELITGGLGGHVIFTLDANGKPQEILIMDTESTSTAVNVLRINQNGIGFSSNGYDGPFTSAWTLDGAFVADFITAGHLSANMIQGGTLTLGGLNNGNGVMRLLDASGNQVGLFNKDGVEATAGEIGGWTITGTTLQSLDSQNRGFTFSSQNNYIDLNGGGSGCKIGAQPDIGVGAGLLFYGELIGQPYFQDIARIYQAAYQNILKIEIYNGGECSIIGDVSISGDLVVSGSKNRAVKTEKHGDRLLHAYETASPYFGDIGEAETDKAGRCEVPIDSIFSETVDLDGYHVFLQKQGPGDIWVAEKTADHFTVEGTPGLKFSWELKAKQIDHNNRRLEETKR